MLAACAALPLAHVLADERPASKPSRMGVVIHSCPIRSAASRKQNDAVPFSDPVRFLEHCRALGAGGIQVSIGTRDREYVGRLREKAQAAGMYLEGSIRLPQDRADVDRFTSEVRTAKEAGATVLRTVAMTGRRYETLATAAAFREFAMQAERSLALAEPVVAKHDMRLAIENHKDWRIEELLSLLKRLESKHVGVCVDTGNSIALLEDPLAVVEAYAPWALSVHLKDMAVAEYEDGFLLSEVPLGTGYLDLDAIVRTLRKARPEIHFNLEMITRDPLQVPCLTRKYWATMEETPARELAEALHRLRKHAAKQPLPRVSNLSPEKQLEAEDANIRACFTFAREKLSL
jgi:sugar phosphate isomerase/epimerase